MYNVHTLFIYKSTVTRVFFHNFRFLPLDATQRAVLYTMRYDRRV